jgi:alpha-tubulin suppressor-like RCC1 family protein
VRRVLPLLTAIAALFGAGGCEGLLGADFGPKQLVADDREPGDGISDPSNADGGAHEAGATPKCTTDCVPGPGVPHACASGVCAVTGGLEHTCALLSAGAVKCWGNGDHGELGNGGAVSSLSPVTVIGILDARAISAGSRHTCALAATGRVKCWGSSSRGQLGDPSVPVGPDEAGLAAAEVAGVGNVRGISAGLAHTCAVDAKGAVKCWGSNETGQLGRGSKELAVVAAVDVLGIANATAVGAGSAHSCALLSTGSIRCWGSNTYGQLGDGSKEDALRPVDVAGISNAVAISAGGWHTCALLDGGSIRCWGSSSSGQISGALDASAYPVSVGVTNATGIATGTDHSCALIAGGTLACWGSNGFGQLGNVSAPARTVAPTGVTGVATATAAGTGSAHMCAVLGGIMITCWGTNGSGQVGNRTIGLKVPTAGDAVVGL